MPEYYLGVLNIILIILKDNESLGSLILPDIAYKILRFVRNSKMNEKQLLLFEDEVI